MYSVTLLFMLEYKIKNKFLNPIASLFGRYICVYFVYISIHIILFSGLKFYLENHWNQKLNNVETFIGYWHDFKLYLKGYKWSEIFGKEYLF